MVSKGNRDELHPSLSAHCVATLVSTRKSVVHDKAGATSPLLTIGLASEARSTNALPPPIVPHELLDSRSVVNYRT
jgi:hypothetical protein